MTHKNLAEDWVILNFLHNKKNDFDAMKVMTQPI